VQPRPTGRPSDDFNSAGHSSVFRNIQLPRGGSPRVWTVESGKKTETLTGARAPTERIEQLDVGQKKSLLTRRAKVMRPARVHGRATDRTRGTPSSTRKGYTDGEGGTPATGGKKKKQPQTGYGGSPHGSFPIDRVENGGSRTAETSHAYILGPKEEKTCEGKKWEGGAGKRAKRGKKQSCAEPNHIFSRGSILSDSPPRS